MAGNLSSGNRQSYDDGEGLRLFAGMHPDVAMIQEFNYRTNDGGDFDDFVDAGFGPGFSYARGANTTIPNGVVSRYPILESGDWTDSATITRAYTWAHIDLPGPKKLWVVSLHLLTANSTTRNNEATEILSYITDGGIPASDYLVIGGDFNTNSRGELCLGTFASEFVTAAPYPADQNGNSNTNATRSKPYDWVLGTPNLVAHQVPVVIGAQQFDGGLVFDSRVYTPLDDVAPALHDDSDAPQMQHMGVVKDFLVPQ